MKAALAFALLMLLAPPTVAQDDKLIGFWEAAGQPGKTAEFRADGTFRYIYNPTPPRTVLQLKWSRSWFGKLTLAQENGDGARSCSYKVDGDTLTIDDGGRSCIPHRPVEMPTRFTRVK